MAIKTGLKNSLNKIREISSDIYHQYIPIIDDDTDITKFAQPILSVPEVYNEFCNTLINRIVYTAIDTKTFNNPLAKLEGSQIPLGYIGQEIYINPAKGRRYNPNDFAGILQKYESDVKVQYLTKNLDIQYPVTVIRTKLKQAFVSWDKLDEFITGIINSLYNGLYIDEFNFTKSLVSSAYSAGNVRTKVIQNPTSSESIAKEFIVQARTDFLNFQMPSTNYNAWALVGGSGRPVTTWVDPEDIVLLLRNDIRGYVDVNVLADAFQIDKTVLLGNIYPVDTFDLFAESGEKIFDGSKIYGILADRNWFKIKLDDRFMENGYNANNRALQYFLNNIKMYEYSLFANAIVYCSEAAKVTITGIEFDKTSVDITYDANGSNTQQLIVKTTPGSGNNPAITYTMTDDTVATVASNSNNNKQLTITGLKKGKTTLTATAGNVTATIPININ